MKPLLLMINKTNNLYSPLGRVRDILTLFFFLINNKNPYPRPKPGVGEFDLMSSESTGRHPKVYSAKSRGSILSLLNTLKAVYLTTSQRPLGGPFATQLVYVVGDSEAYPFWS
jgi:hypothetical protein